MEADHQACRVIDLVNGGQLVQAESVLEIAIMKYPSHVGLRVAGALVDLETNNIAAAKVKAEQLSKEKVTNPTYVNALVKVLQNCCSWEALVSTYEMLRPLQNERQTSENLIQVYARMGSYDKLQQLATQLYRQYNDPKYQAWMVLGALARVPSGSNDDILLKVASKLLDTSVLTEKGCMNSSTVRTYVDVLVQQGACADAIEFLKTDRGAKIGLLETRLEVLAALLQKVDRAAAANAVAQHFWRMETDNWTAFVLYKDTLGTPQAEERAADTTMDDEVLVLPGPQPELQASIDCSAAHYGRCEALRFVRELQKIEEASRPGKVRRGPFLAELSLLHEWQSAELPAKIVAYVARFYRKPSCYLDVSTFLVPPIAEQIATWAAEAPSTSADRDVLDPHIRRILSFKCKVATWSDADSTPAAPQLREMMAACVEQYEDCRSLSTSLVWNEEGLCDGYITVALNIALRGYAKSSPRDYSFLVEGLDLMGRVDRRLNNPTWLIYSTCFSNLLGLADVAAHHQLAFKSVQHDTMTHIGYWPMLSGVAIDDIVLWEGWAENYYGHLERECSLLRAKVFVFTSWQVLQDVRTFERRQMCSLYRWMHPGHEFAAALTGCQTQKDVAKLFGSRVTELWAAYERLRDAVEVVPGSTDHPDTGSSANQLVDNTDWLLARSMVLGNIHSAHVQELATELVKVPSPSWLLRRGKQLLSSILVLHDMTAIQQHQRSQQTSGTKNRKGKGKGGSVDAAAAAATASPTLYCKKILERESTLDCLPALKPVVAALEPYLRSVGEVSVEYAAGFADYLALLTAVPPGGSAAAFEDFLYPQAYLLAALWKVLPVKMTPVKRWAGEMQEVLEVALQRYAAGTWSTLCPTVGQAESQGRPDTASSTSSAIAIPASGFAAKLMNEKLHRLEKYVSNLRVEVSAFAR